MSCLTPLMFGPESQEQRQRYDQNFHALTSVFPFPVVASFTLLKLKFFFPQLRARPNVELFMSGTKLRELSS